MAREIDLTIQLLEPDYHFVLVWLLWRWSTTTMTTTTTIRIGRELVAS